MLIAKVVEDKVVEVDEHDVMFKNVSFPQTGPDLEWLNENSCVVVGTHKDYDPSTHKLERVDYYVENNIAYTVKVVPLTKQEIADYVDSLRIHALALRDDLLAQAEPNLSADIVNRKEWVAYCDVLRSIEKQSTFPKYIDWPSQPVVKE